MSVSYSCHFSRVAPSYHTAKIFKRVLGGKMGQQSPIEIGSRMTFTPLRGPT